MTRKIITVMLILSVIILTPLMAFSEEKEMTLEESINISLKENPNMKKADSILKEADLYITETRGTMLPHVDVGVDYTRVGNIATLDMKQFGMTGNFQDENNYKCYAKLTQMLFDYRLITSYELSKLNLLDANYRYDKTKQDVLYNVNKTYYNVLLANSSLAIADETVIQYQTQLERTQKMYKQGSVPKYDVLRVEVNLASAQEDYIKASNNIDISKASFNNALGIALSNPVNIKKLLSYMPWKVNYDESLAYAFKNRPEILQVDNMVAIAEEKIQYAKGERYPSVNLSANYYSQNDTLVQPPNTWNLTVGASMPIFHGCSIKARIEKAEEQLSQVNDDKTLTYQSVELDVKQSYLNLNEAFKRIDVAEKNVAQAEESKRMADLRYKGGVASIQEVLDTQTSLTSAKTNYLQAIYDYEMAKISLKKAMGMLGKSEQ
ncbi:MAG: TolC family protein [Candidatus Eremiobacterota bacterium]